MQVPQHAQSWRGRRDVRLNDVCGGSEQQLGPHQWPGRFVATPAHTRGLSSVDPKLWVRWKYVRRRCSSKLARSVGTIRCHSPGFARSFGFGPWIADVRGG
jgi:hypothetical protein